MKPFQLIFNYARKYTFSLVITAISMLALVGIQLLIPWIVKLLVAEVTAPAASMADMGFITQLTVIVLIAYIGRAGLQFVRSYIAHVAGWGVVADVRKYIYNHMQRLPCVFMKTSRSGR
jgi:ATP-binding cassette subfamily B protein